MGFEGMKVTQNMGAHHVGEQLTLDLSDAVLGRNRTPMRYRQECQIPIDGLGLGKLCFILW